MDELSAHTGVHLTDTYRRVIRDIENLEQFYEAKVLAISSGDKPETRPVHFGSEPTQPKEKKPWHLKYLYGQTASDSSSSSNGSWFPGRDVVPDTPPAAIPNSKAKEKMKSRWVPPTSVHGNNYYPSSVLNKDGYLGFVLTFSDDLRASDTTLPSFYVTCLKSICGPLG
jgi:hypothetical protein